jgi:hypothetical protein
MKFRIISTLAVLAMIAASVIISAEGYHPPTAPPNSSPDEGTTSSSVSSGSGGGSFLHPAEDIYTPPLRADGATNPNTYDWTFQNADVYSTMLSLGISEFKMSELTDGYIPQGVAIYEKENWLLVSSYHDSGKKKSIITVYDLATGERVKTLGIRNKSGSDYTGHAGGIACSDIYLWLSVNYAVCPIPLWTVSETEDGQDIHCTDYISVPVIGSYVSISNGVLWVGEFYHPATAATDKSHAFTARDETEHHALTVGYKLNDNYFNELCEANYDRTKYLVPDYALSVVDMVQGFAQLPNGDFALSQSYGRQADSSIYFHSSPLNDKADGTFTVSGKKVPLWFLDGNNMRLSLQAPPMSEGITAFDGKMYVVFESGTKYYSEGIVNPTDSVWSLDLKRYEELTTKRIPISNYYNPSDAI